MNILFNQSLENIINNKIFIILISISAGIALRFSIPLVSLKGAIILLITLFVLYKLIFQIYNQYVIRNDLQKLAGKEMDGNEVLYLIDIIVILILTTAALGYTAAAFRFEYMAPKTKLTTILKDIEIIGNIKQFEIRENGIRIYLQDVFQVTDDDFNVKKLDLGIIRVNLKQKFGYDNIIGKWVKLKATIAPPPSEAFPNSFNFAQYAFFKGIGAIGYSLQRLYIIDFKDIEFSLLNTIEEKLNILRKKITFKIKNAIPEPASGITSAILVGENTQIHPDDYYALRVAGLAHIIAISGMHVVVVVALCFFFIKAILLYLIPLLTRIQIALYISVSKISAIFSILLSTFYVFLAGAPVSAQRALITSSILMLCMVYDRKLHPIKSLCLVAIIMLLITPESLFAPGLQMSFAACFALVATFGLCDEFLHKWHLNKYFEYFLKLILASAAASIATAPFIIYHFNQFAPYGIIANLICVPLSDFVMMPFGMASILLMPFGLEKFALIPVKYSIDLMLFMAHQISKLPHSDIYVSGLTNYGIIIISIGLFTLCISNKKMIKISGIIIALVGCCMVQRYDQIVLMVSQKSFAIRYDTVSDSNEKKYIISSKQKDRFIHDVWMGKLGQDNFFADSLNKLSKKRNIGIRDCNADMCTFTLSKDHKGLIINKELSEDIKCNEFQILINMYNDKKCDGLINITADNLKENGIHIISYNNGFIINK